jgi:NADPH:quinone reductase-like Zn-dependent oxidoreductase
MDRNLIHDIRGASQNDQFGSHPRRRWSLLFTKIIMKAAIVHKNGDPCQSDVLSVVDDVPKPVIKAGEILVQIKAAAINPIDWKLVRGDLPGLTLPPGSPLGCDVAGVVETIGPECETSLSVGDEIYANTFATKGAFAEYCSVKAAAAYAKPKNCTFQEAASLPLVGLTALQGLVTHGGFQSGMSVCVLGGSGGYHHQLQRTKGGGRLGGQRH